MSTENKQYSPAYNLLPPKRQRFVDEYVVDFNATQAAIRSGYSPRSASSQADDLLRNPEVKAAVDERRRSIKRKSINHKHWLLRKTKKIIEKCTDDERWNPQGANGAVRNMVDILGLRTEKKEISGPAGGPIQIEYDYSKLSTEELKTLLALAEKAGKR